jgi:hypothetical protein
MNMSEQRTTNLRLYRALPGKLDEFVKGWQELIVPMRERHGFRVEYAWKLREQDVLAWVISLPGDAAHFSQAQEAYVNSPGREEINQNVRPLMDSNGPPVGRLGGTYFAEPVEIKPTA